MLRVYSGAGSCHSLILARDALDNAHTKALSHFSRRWAMLAPSWCVMMETCALGRSHCSQKDHSYLGNQYDCGGWAVSVVFAKVFPPSDVWRISLRFRWILEEIRTVRSPFSRHLRTFLRTSEWVTLSHFRLTAASDGPKMWTVGQVSERLAWFSVLGMDQATAGFAVGGLDLLLFYNWYLSLQTIFHPAADFSTGNSRSSELATASSCLTTFVPTLELVVSAVPTYFWGPQNDNATWLLSLGLPWSSSEAVKTCEECLKVSCNHSRICCRWEENLITLIMASFGLLSLIALQTFSVQKTYFLPCSKLGALTGILQVGWGSHPPRCSNMDI